MRSAIAAHLGSRQVARVIYGAIISMALVVALEDHPPSPGVMVATLLGTAVAVGLAELYSEWIGTETRKRRHVEAGDVRPIVAEVVAVAFGISFPAVFFVLAAAGAFEVQTAFRLAKWSGLGLIAFYGFCAGRVAGDGVPAALLQAAYVGLIGVVLIALKALVH
jgi:hypothetical protein